jgi:hypothetical protein
MIVLGRHSFIFESTGQTCTVKPFSSELGQANNVPIVDGAIAYDDPYTGETFLLLIRNALYIPSMDVNLIPPFIMRAGGVIVNDVLKIHCSNPTTSDHSISFQSHDLRIPLSLNGTFSYFHHRIPTSDKIHGCDKIFITPDSHQWNPHCQSFSQNEKSMLDYQGYLTEPERRLHLLMEPEHDPSSNYELSSVTSTQWNNNIDSQMNLLFQSSDETNHSNCGDTSISELAELLSTKAEISKFGASIGSCNIGFTNTNNEMDDLFDNSFSTTLDDLEALFEKDINPSTSISSTTATKPKGVSKSTLSKLWNISEKLADGVINNTTQFNRQNADNSLSRNFSTNDRMLRYKRINSTFFTDTMFVTDRAKSTCNNKGRVKSL